MHNSTVSVEETRSRLEKLIKNNRLYLKPFDFVLSKAVLNSDSKDKSSSVERLRFPSETEPIAAQTIVKDFAKDLWEFIVAGVEYLVSEGDTFFRLKHFITYLDSVSSRADASLHEFPTALLQVGRYLKEDIESGYSESVPPDKYHRIRTAMSSFGVNKQTLAFFEDVVELLDEALGAADNLKNYSSFASNILHRYQPIAIDHHLCSMTKYDNFSRSSYANTYVNAFVELNKDIVSPEKIIAESFKLLDKLVTVYEHEVKNQQLDSSFPVATIERALYESAHKIVTVDDVERSFSSFKKKTNSDIAYLHHRIEQSEYPVDLEIFLPKEKLLEIFLPEKT